MHWTCADQGTAAFDGYASPMQKLELSRTCAHGVARSAGTLPFTGVDLTVVLIVAVLLVAFGLVLRHAVRNDEA